MEVIYGNKKGYYQSGFKIRVLSRMSSVQRTFIIAGMPIFNQRHTYSFNIFNEKAYWVAPYLSEPTFPMAN